MDYKTLLPIILKKAMESSQVSPEEVMAILQKNNKGNDEDKNTETVDGNILDTESAQKEDVKNDEGKILESGFKELEVEDAIDQAKEQRKFDTNPGEANQVIKTSSLWDMFVQKYL